MWLPSAPHRQRDLLARRVLRAGLASLQAPPFTRVELHCVHWSLSRESARETLAALSPRVAALLPSTFDDAPDPTPYGDPLAALPLEHLNVTEAVALLRGSRWTLVAVERVFPLTGRLDRPLTTADQYDVLARRAGRRAFTFYASLRWGFIYPKPAARTMRALRRSPTT